MKPITRTSRSGRNSTTGAPTPACSADRVFACSASRSMPSNVVSLRLHRATKTPRGVVTLRLRFVSPPGSSTIVRGWSARLGIWSKSSSSDEGAHRSSPASAMSSVDTVVETLVRRPMRVRSAR